MIFKVPSNPALFYDSVIIEEKLLFVLFVCGSHLLRGQVTGVALWFSP